MSRNVNNYWQPRPRTIIRRVHITASRRICQNRGGRNECEGVKIMVPG